ncbi:MAG: hypothetical protein V7L04_13485 [Nostoc sp.]
MSDALSLPYPYGEAQRLIEKGYVSYERCPEPAVPLRGSKLRAASRREGL